MLKKTKGFWWIERDPKPKIKVNKELKTKTKMFRQFNKPHFGVHSDQTSSAYRKFNKLKVSLSFFPHVAIVSNCIWDEFMDQWSSSIPSDMNEWGRGGEIQTRNHVVHQVKLME